MKPCLTNESLLDWRIVSQNHPNVLIRAAATLEATIESLGLRDPVHVQTIWSRRDAPTRGTLVLYGIDRLDAAQQRDLLAWLEAHQGVVQLVSVSGEPLLPRIERNQFLDALYYRLNTIFVDTVSHS